jgi:hypothetical protein
MLTKGKQDLDRLSRGDRRRGRRPVLIAALFHSNTNPTAAFTTLGQVNDAGRAADG